jgi:hypothetical protein
MQVVEGDRRVLAGCQVEEGGRCLLEEFVVEGKEGE